MKNFMVLLFIYGILSCSNQNIDQKHNEKKKSAIYPAQKTNILDSLFQYHFRILDSVAKRPYKDTMYRCCHESIEFMEENTHILSDSESDYFGSTGFKKEDLKKWHHWYDSVKSAK